MTDLTPLFDSLLATHSGASTTKRTFSVDSLDDFLKEAYTINHAIRTLHTDLLRIRQSYLSTAQPRRTLIRQNGGQPLTDRDREEIDANSKQLLRDLNAKIRQLADAEQIRQETEAQLLKKKFARGLSALGSWAAGGAGASGKSVEYKRAEEAANSVNTHRESVLWMLRQRLQECVKTQQGMMEVRLNREMEKQRSVLARAGVTEGMSMSSMPGASTKNPSSPNSRRRPSQAAWQDDGQQQPLYNPQDELSPEQIQMFEKENHDMLQHYESVLGQVRTAEKSLIEISELQTQLVSNLATQSAHIDQLVADSANITEEVGGGNKQLKSATKKPSPANGSAIGNYCPYENLPTLLSWARVVVNFRKTEEPRTTEILSKSSPPEGQLQRVTNQRHAQLPLHQRASGPLDLVSHPAVTAPAEVLSPGPPLPPTRTSDAHLCRISPPAPFGESHQLCEIRSLAIEEKQPASYSETVPFFFFLTMSSSKSPQNFDPSYHADSVRRVSSLVKQMSAPSPTSFTAEVVPQAPEDPLFGLMRAYKADQDPKKVDLGIGAYRDDNAKPWVLPVVKKADEILRNDPELNHEYAPIAGIPSFTGKAAELILGGTDSPAIKEKRVTSVQTISGTGAVHLGALFLAKFYPGTKKVYLSNPTWANHNQIFSNVGVPIATYPYFSKETKGLDFKGMKEAIYGAPDRSIILLHACAHNPTGVDPTMDQWKELAEIIRSKGHIPFFDTAYQGFATGDLSKDNAAVRYFVEQGFELLVAQSFAKNFGLYGERAGCFHVVTGPGPEAQTTIGRIASQLAILQRSEISNPPLYGARIASTVLNDPKLYAEWEDNLRTMSGRIITMRKELRSKLEALGTPGTWNHITDQIGMFSFTGLTEAQVLKIREESHIYMTKNGRISMAGLNTGNVDYVAKAIDKVVREV